eukprot:2006177-Amphidinium_carterae.1
MAWARREFFEAAANKRQPDLSRVQTVRLEVLHCLGRPPIANPARHEGIIPELIEAFVNAASDADNDLAE